MVAAAPTSGPNRKPPASTSTFSFDVSSTAWRKASSGLPASLSLSSIFGSLVRIGASGP